MPDLERYVEIETQRLHWRPAAPADADLINFCDAIEEGRSSNAIEYYGGDFLPGHYEDWIVLERERLRALAADALASAATEAESRHDHDAMLIAAHQLLRLDPLREDGCRLAMRAHAGRGERAEALRAYHRCVEALHRELNVEPDAATVAVYENLRLAGGGASTGRTAESPAAGTATTSLLIGREEEWELARAMWDSAAAGRAGVLLVTGEPGIGKSRLVDELARFAGATGHLVARASAYPGAGRLPWGPVIEWLRSDDLRPNGTRLSTERRAELGRLLPEHRSVPTGPPLVAGVEPSSRRELFDAITAALVEGERPTMLVIDDLQWCDNDTIDAVSFMLHQAPQAPLLVAATARTEEIAADHPVRALLAALVRDGRAAELRLTPLQQAATADLAGRLLGGDVDDEVARRLWAETEGNPLFIIEALRASAGERLHKMSPTVQSVIRERLAQLSPAARSVAEVAAVVGRAFRVDVVASAMATGEDDLVDALDELWSKRIIREHGDGYDFTHDLLREATHDSISPARRRKLHRAVVGSLAAVFGPELGPLSVRLAPHYEEAGLYVEAVEAYQHAAEYALEVFALDDAISLLRRALVLFEHLKPGHERDQAELAVRITLGSALAARDGYGSASVSLNYERALDLCAGSLHRIEPAVLRGLGLAALVACRFDRSMRFAQALLDHREDGIAVVEGHYLMGVSQFWRGRLHESSEHLRSAIDQYQVGRASEHRVRFSQDPKAVCLVRLAFTTLWRGEPDLATTLVSEARRYAESIHHPTTLAYVLVWSGMLAVELDDRRGLREAVDSNEELCSRHPLDYFTAIARPLRGWLDVLDGRPDGVAAIAAAVDGWRVEAHAHLTYGLLLLARSHLRTGDIGAGRQAVCDGIDWGRRQDVAWAEAELRTVDGELLIAAGDPVSGAEALRKATAVAEKQRAGWPHGHATRALALVQTV